MKEAPGTRFISRALLLGRSTRTNAVRGVLSSPALVRWGAVALVLAGVTGLVAEALYLVAMSGASGGALAYAENRTLLDLSFLLQGVPGRLLISFGLVGLCALLSGVRELPFRLALAGAASSLLSAVVPLGLSLLGGLVSYPILSFVLWSLETGVLLSGIAALWARGLGRWRSLPLVVCLLSTPLIGFLAYLAYPGGWPPDAAPIGWESELLLMSPETISNVGWVLFGWVLFGAKEREAASIARERRVLEEENRRKALLLYEEAFGAGDLSVVDELVAPDFFDRRRERRGPEGLKRTVADLRRTFPDLGLSVERQVAKGDTVTTRCVLSGTDLGGVLWYPPTGKHATFTGTYVDRFSGGSLVEHGGESDTASLLQQLGLPAG